MTNLEKKELRNLCDAGYTFDDIRSQVGCSDATIRRYMKVFSPKMDEVVPKPDNTEELSKEVSEILVGMTVDYEVAWKDGDQDALAGIRSVTERRIVQLITTHIAKRERQARDDELERMANHWFNCGGDDCEFSEGTHICGYYEHRKAEIDAGGSYE